MPQTSNRKPTGALRPSFRQPNACNIATEHGCPGWPGIFGIRIGRYQRH